MSRLRVIGLALVLIGLVVPWAIDAYENANRLDISRDIGSLPWLILLILGLGILIYSFFRK